MNFYEEADARAKKMVIEKLAERVTFLAERFSIPLECLDASPVDIESRLNQAEYASLSVKPSDIAKEIVDGRTWGRQASTIIIEGGDRFSREEFANICLAMGLMANIKEDGETIARIHMSQIIPVFNSFEDARFEMTDRLSKAKVLLIEEIDPPQITTTRNDLRYMMDSVLINRKSSKFPTILTLSEKSSKYKTGDHGKMLHETIQSQHSKDKGVWRIILSGV